MHADLRTLLRTGLVSPWCTRCGVDVVASADSADAHAVVTGHRPEYARRRDGALERRLTRKGSIADDAELLAAADCRR